MQLWQFYVLVFLRTPKSREKKRSLNQAKKARSIAQEQDSGAKAFDSIISSGYRPKEGTGTMDFVYFSYKYTMPTTLSSTVTNDSAKFANIDISSSVIDATYSYGISDDTIFGITISNAFSENTSTRYSAYAKSAEYKDNSKNKSGINDPTIFLDKILNEDENLRVTGNISLSPGMGNGTDSNSVRGGSAFGAGFELFKSNDKLEFNTGIAYSAYTSCKAESDSSSSETSGENQIAVKLGVNVLIGNNSSIGPQITKYQYDSSTLKYKESTTQYDTAGYGSTSYLIGFKNAISKDLSFMIGYVGQSLDGTLTNNQRSIDFKYVS